MMQILARASRFVLGMNQANRYSFGGMPASFLRSHQASNTQIVSLSSEETEQLLSINSYGQSVQQLRKNNLRESLVYLQNSLVQTKAKFPWSINLQVCLLSRVSILLKLLNQNRQFQETLEEIYLLTLSARGSRHLDTIKSLINYAISLTIHRPQKCGLLLDYLKSEGELPEYMLFFDAFNDIHSKKLFKEGISKMEGLSQESSDEKIFKFNNIAFMKILCLRQRFKNPVQYLSQLKNNSEQILRSYLTALVEAQSNPQSTSNYSQQQIKQSQKLVDLISGYLSKQRPSLSSQELGSKNILKHSNSHIIAMNIASLLFQLERVKESFYMLQLSLQKAMNLQELERVGMGLVLLGRCYFLQESDKWQDVYLDLLQHTQTYPKLIIKQALSSYSRLLFQRGRLFEAENYLNQSLSIEADSSLQGLILPSYDFSF